MVDLEIPLLPLHSVLYPDGPMPLRIFEPRYTDMISQCLKNNTGFGVSLIRQGRELGPGATTFDIGTIANIHDWHMRHDNILGITVTGVQRFRILQEYTKPNQLIMARIELIENEAPLEVPDEYSALVEVLKSAMSEMAHRYSELPKRYDDASWVGNRLAELLPLKQSQKQYFLQLDNPLLRLERIADAMEQLDSQSSS